MDTIADKALNIMLIVLLLDKVEIVLIPLIMELLIGIINLVAFFTGKKAKTRYLGKVKMWMISITIILGYAYYFDIIDYPLIFIGSFVTGIMQGVVVFDYISYLSSSKAVRKKKVGIEKINFKELKKILFDTEYYMENN